MVDNYSNLVFRPLNDTQTKRFYSQRLDWESFKLKYLHSIKKKIVRPYQQYRLR